MNAHQAEQKQKVFTHIRINYILAKIRLLGETSEIMFITLKSLQYYTLASKSQLSILVYRKKINWVGGR